MNSGGRILLAAGGAAFLLVAVGFLGLALFTLLRPSLDMAGAAGLTGLILLLVPAAWLVWKKSLRPPPTARRAEADTLAVLAAMAREKPLLALLGAGLFGFADYLLTRRNRKPGRGVLL